MNSKSPVPIVPIAIATACLFAACEQRAEVPSPAKPSSDAKVLADSSEPPAQSSAVTADSEDPQVKVNVEIVGGKAFRELLARHAGDVVFVDYWATW